MKNRTLTKAGYVMIDRPDWLVGDSTMAYEHIVVWCAAHNQLPKLPDGYIVHHIDTNRQNNSIDNLRMMTIGDHSRLHAEMRRANRKDLVSDKSTVVITNCPVCNNGKKSLTIKDDGSAVCNVCDYRIK